MELAKLSLEILKFSLALVGLLYVRRQLLNNRLAAKDKLIYDVNKGMEAYGEAISHIEAFRDSIRRYQADQSTEKEIRSKLIEFESKEEVVMQIKKQTRDLLRMFETVMMMLETRVIRDDDIFPLIGYRIITVLNSPLVQKTFLFRRVDTSEESEIHIQPAYRFASVFALYERVMRYTVMRFYKKSRFGNRDGERFMDEFQFIAAFDLIVVEKWQYEFDDFKDHLGAKFSSTKWLKNLKRPNFDSIESLWFFQDQDGKLSPFDTAISIYQGHRPNRKPLNLDW